MIILEETRHGILAIEKKKLVEILKDTSAKAEYRKYTEVLEREGMSID